MTGDEYLKLKADLLVLQVLVPHALGMAINSYPDPATAFKNFYDSSRENLLERTKHDGGDPATNAMVLRMAADKHDALLEELRRALGLRKHAIQ